MVSLSLSHPTLHIYLFLYLALFPNTIYKFLLDFFLHSFPLKSCYITRKWTRKIQKRIFIFPKHPKHIYRWTALSSLACQNSLKLKEKQPFILFEVLLMTIEAVDPAEQRRSSRVEHNVDEVIKKKKKKKRKRCKRKVSIQVKRPVKMVSRTLQRLIDLCQQVFKGPGTVPSPSDVRRLRHILGEYSVRMQ